MSRGRGYVLISPCRDEAEYMRRTLDSVLAQTELPACWVIVDDGSTDETPAILAAYAAEHSFIRVITRKDRGRRKVGPGVIEAFFAGYDAIRPEEFEFLCKLDLDLDLPPRYFEILAGRMRADERIGTCSGKPYFNHPRTGALVSERCGDENSVGMTKFYRTRCFTEIGGFVPEVMWDGIDGHRCRMAGWIAVSWDEPDLRFMHLRPMGSSQVGIWTGRLRHGYGQYFMGTGLLYMSASAAFRMTRPPRVVGGLGMLLGYLRSMFRGDRRYGEPGFRAFLRTYQAWCLQYGKADATKRLEARQAAVWRERARLRGGEA